MSEEAPATTFCADFYKQLLNVDVPNYISVETYKLRVLQKILDRLQLSMKEIFALQNKTYVHPECSSELRKVLKKYSIPITKREEMVLSTVFASDYNDREDLEWMADILNEKAACHEEVAHQFNWIFAVDGFTADLSYRNYIDHLRFGLREVFPRPVDPLAVHVGAVRSLYGKFRPAELSPLRVHECVLEAYQSKHPLKYTTKNYVDYVAFMYDKIKEEVIEPKMEKEAVEVKRVKEEPQMIQFD